MACRCLPYVRKTHCAKLTEKLARLWTHHLSCLLQLLEEEEMYLCCALHRQKSQVLCHQQLLLLLHYFFPENSDTFTISKLDIYLLVTIEYLHKVSNHECCFIWTGNIHARSNHWHAFSRQDRSKWTSSHGKMGETQRRKISINLQSLDLYTGNLFQ